MLKRSTLPSIGLFGVFAIAGAGFWQFNNATLRDHRELEARGISVSGHIESASYSHKSCDSSMAKSKYLAESWINYAIIGHLIH